jgi:hypothetical protein
MRGVNLNRGFVADRLNAQGRILTLAKINKVALSE